MTIEICGKTHKDPHDALGWLKGRGINQTQVAGLLGVGKAYVTDVKNGRKPWKSEWGPRLTTILESGGSEIAAPNPDSNRDLKPVTSTPPKKSTWAEKVL